MALAIEAKVLSAIIDERRRQVQKYGGATHDDTHKSYDWYSFINSKNIKAAQVGEEQFSHEEFRRRMVQVAALAIAAIESSLRRFPPKEQEKK